MQYSKILQNDAIFKINLVLDMTILFLYITMPLRLMLWYRGMLFF